jgi:hypothetical protein
MRSVVQARLNPDSQKALERLAARLGWSQSQIVREGIRMNLSVLASFLGSHTSPAARTAAVKTALQTPAGRMLRDELGSWVIRLLPAETVVPEIYAAWRPLVRDAMLFMISHLSAARLAPKLVEQIDLPPETTPEARLLRLIAKVPGLQKIGQVLAHNRHLDPSLRGALSELENGIRDVRAEDVGALIRKQLGRRLETTRWKSNPAYWPRPASARWCGSPGGIPPAESGSGACSRS